MYVIPCNYGQESIALIEWMHQQQKTNVHCLYVETGWAAPGWSERVKVLEAWVDSLGFVPKTLTPKRDFAELMKEQKKFPTQKFQWCASFLKGLPILEYLDFEWDSEMKSTIVLALRRSASRTLMNLPEWTEASEHYNGRPLWHPLYDKTEKEMDDLVKNSGILDRLGLALNLTTSRRSLECHPCVNSSFSEVNACRSHPEIGPKIKNLEEILQEAFPSSSDKGLNHAFSSLELFLRGCGLPFGCGL